MNLVQRTWRDGKLLDILRLLYFRHDAVASDSRDKIFSLLGLTRDTFSVTEIRYYPPLHGPPVLGHSPLLFDGNPRRCVFDPSARERRGTESSRQGRQ